MGFFSGELDLLHSFFRHCSVMGKGIMFILSPFTVAMAFLSAFSIFLASERNLNLNFNVEFTIFSAGCIFPTTFSVQAAFQRREQAIDLLAKLKSNITALFQHFIFFDIKGESEAAKRAKPLFSKLISHIEIYCRNSKDEQTTTTVNDANTWGGRGRNSCAHYVYDDFVAISQLLQDCGTEHFGFKGDKAIEGSTSRSWQYIHDAIAAFESLRAIRDSSTPVGLRIFCHSLCTISCVALAPFWNHFCKTEHGLEQDLTDITRDMQMQVEAGYGCASAYLLGVLFAFTVLTLYRVQGELENPFDGRGVDDIRWHKWRAEIDALGSHGPDGPRLRSMGEVLKVQQLLDKKKSGL